MEQAQEHPLHTGHTFWVMRRQKKPSRKKEEAPAAAPTEATTTITTATATNPNDLAVEDWAKSLKSVATFRTVEDFWRVYGHLTRPSEMGANMDLYMFREGIKPTWEDPANRRGGKFHVKIIKGVLGSRYWESILLSVIGEQFGEFSNEICGVVISIRPAEDVLSLWMRASDNPEVLPRIRDLFKKSLKLPSFVAIEFKRHDTHHQLEPSVPIVAQAVQQQQQQQPSVPAWRNAKEWRG